MKSKTIKIRQKLKWNDKNKETYKIEKKVQ